MFYIEVDGSTLAKMTYSRAGHDLLIIDHTEVSDALSGKGAGKQLVAKAVDYARENNFKILPLCPFARSIFDKIAQYRDVLST